MKHAKTTLALPAHRESMSRVSTHRCVRKGAISRSSADTAASYEGHASMATSAGIEACLLESLVCSGLVLVCTTRVCCVLVHSGLLRVCERGLVLVFILVFWLARGGVVHKERSRLAFSPVANSRGGSRIWVGSCGLLPEKKMCAPGCKVPCEAVRLLWIDLRSA